MRLLVVSDLEDRELDEAALAEPFDLVISCGDVYNRTYQWLLERIDVPIWAVHGNHDDADWPRPVWNLHGQTRTHGRLRFGGIEGAPRYKPVGRFLYDDHEIEQVARRLPQVDVLVCHSPLAGLHDLPDGVHGGFPALRRFVEQRRPAWMLHGHSGLHAQSTLGVTRVVATRGWRRLELA